MLIILIFFCIMAIQMHEIIFIPLPLLVFEKIFLNVKITTFRKRRTDTLHRTARGTGA